MSDTRTDLNQLQPPSAKRRAAAIIAQYIHELSDRHAEERAGLTSSPSPAR
jgi:hypothetical protein